MTPHPDPLNVSADDRAAQVFSRAALDALSTHIAILDDQGVIQAVNLAWREFGRANGAAPEQVSEGANYFSVCAAASGKDPDAAAFLAGMQAVLHGQMDCFTHEYPCHSDQEKRWFSGRVTRFTHGQGAFLVVAHEDITARFEMRYMDRHGSVSWADVFTTVPRDENGNPLHFDTTSSNIARQKQIEETLLLQGIALDAAANAMVITDHHGTIQWANPAFEKLTGYTIEEVLGCNPRDLVRSGVHTDAFYNAMWETILLGQVWHNQIINRRKDGSLYIEEMTITPVRSAGRDITHFIAVKQDVTDKIKHEKGLENAALENTRLLAETRRQVEQLKSLRVIDETINASLELELTTSVLLEQVISQLKVDAAAILLFNPQSRLLKVANQRGFKTSRPHHAGLHLDRGLPGRAINHRQAIHIPDLQNQAGVLAESPFLKSENFVEYFGIPLISKGVVRGLLEIFNRSPVNPDHNWMDFMGMLAGQAAIAIDNIQMFENLQRTNSQLTQAYDATIEGWSRALDMRDNGTEGHSRRVTEITMRLAKAMGIQGDELVHIRRGSLLHDIGKMGIPDSILLKPASLTDAEWKVMHRHTQYAQDLLSSVKFLHPAMDIPSAHHEKWDGTGYPRGLKGTQIPLAARIFAIADVWDGITSDRPYRAAWPREKAIEYIRSQAGKHFDPAVVEMFFKVYLGEHHPVSRPVILIVAQEDGPVQALAHSLKDTFTVITAHSGQAALKLFESSSPGLVLTENWIPGLDGVENWQAKMSGLDLLERIQAMQPTTSGFVVSTSSQTVTLTAPVQMRKSDETSPSPWNLDSLHATLNAAIRRYPDPRPRAGPAPASD